MSKFFNSELVRNDMKELENMQKKLYQEMMYVPFYDKEQKRGHLVLMKDFLEKNVKQYNILKLLKENWVPLYLLVHKHYKLTNLNKSN